MADKKSVKLVVTFAERGKGKALASCTQSRECFAITSLWGGERPPQTFWTFWVLEALRRIF